MGPLQALARASANYQRHTIALPHLGVPGCERHAYDRKKLPARVIAEIHSQTKDPNILCLEYMDDGVKKLDALLSPCSWPKGAELAKKLVKDGAHPLDIIFATYIPDRDEWQFRNAVEMLFWTYEDQWRLDPPEEDDQP